MSLLRSRADNECSLIDHSKRPSSSILSKKYSYSRPASERDTNIRSMFPNILRIEWTGRGSASPLRLKERCVVNVWTRVTEASATRGIDWVKYGIDNQLGNICGG